MLSPSLDPGHQRHPSFTPTENESNPSYENPPDGAESDIEDGYIIVLADQPKDELPPTSESRASSLSSEDDHPYVNVQNMKHGDDSDKKEYLNVEPLQSQGAAAGDKGDSDDDDDEGNYVNVSQQ